jgi:hypothetical protein
VAALVVRCKPDLQHSRRSGERAKPVRSPKMKLMPPLKKWRIDRGYAQKEEEA